MWNHKLIAGVLAALSLAGIVAGNIMLFHSVRFGLCPALDSRCINQDILFGIAKPLYWSTYLLPPFFFLLMFVRKDIFWRWAKFIAIFVAAGLWLIIGAQPLGELLWPDRTSMTESVVNGLVILSVVFILGNYVWGYLKARK